MLHFMYSYENLHKKVENMKQGITINCKVAHIKKVDAKEYDGKIQNAHQVLQCLIINDTGMSQIDVKDKDITFDEKEMNKDVSLAVNYSVIGNKAFFRLV